MMRHVLRKRFALGVVAAVVVALSGCGSSGGDGSTEASSAPESSEPLTVAAYGKQAEAICRKTDARQTESLEQLAAEHPPSSSQDQEQLAELSTQAAKPIYQTMLEELEGLQPPVGQKEDRYRQWVELVAKAVDKMEAPPTVAVNATVAAHRRAKSLGIEACAVV